MSLRLRIKCPPISTHPSVVVLALKTAALGRPSNTASLPAMESNSSAHYQWDRWSILLPVPRCLFRCDQFEYLSTTTAPRNVTYPHGKYSWQDCCPESLPYSNLVPQRSGPWCKPRRASCNAVYNIELRNMIVQVLTNQWLDRRTLGRKLWKLRDCTICEPVIGIH